MLTDELVIERDIKDEIFDKYRSQLKDAELVDLISLVSQYVLFSLVNNALRIQVEPYLEGITGLET
jgi:alkylhydroperoxidase family enzyme